MTCESSWSPFDLTVHYGWRVIGVPQVWPALQLHHRHCLILWDGKV